MPGSAEVNPPGARYQFGLTPGGMFAAANGESQQRQCGPQGRKG